MSISVGEQLGILILIVAGIAVNLCICSYCLSQIYQVLVEIRELLKK